MYIRNYMTKNPVTIEAGATISEAVSLMNETKVHRIPVLDDGKLVGLITDGAIKKASPSNATSLSIYEINYLLSKMVVRDVMTKNVVTTTPDVYIEAAMKVMNEHDISCLPVLDNDKLVGIITENDMFDAVINILGYHKHGTSRVTVDVREDKAGVLARLTLLAKGCNVSIHSITVFREETPLKVVFRVNTTNVDDLVKAFEDDDFHVSNVEITE